MLFRSPVNFQARRIELELFDRKFEALDATASVEAAHPIPLKSIIEPGPSHRAGPDEVLTTDDVCDAFRDVGLNGLAWRTMLTKNRPEWLLKCRADTGKQGASPVQAIWYPLKIATALVTGKCRKAGAVPASTLDRAFRQNALLKPFAQQWLDIRNDQPSWGD